MESPAGGEGEGEGEEEVVRECRCVRGSEGGREEGREGGRVDNV